MNEEQDKKIYHLIVKKYNLDEQRNDFYFDNLEYVFKMMEFFIENSDSTYNFEIRKEDESKWI